MREAEKLDKRREALGIKSSHLSESAGYDPSSWGNAVRGNYHSDEMLKRVEAALDYYERNGIIPMPQEIQ